MEFRLNQPKIGDSTKFSCFTSIQKAYECPYCFFKSNLKVHLTSHMTLHEGTISVDKLELHKCTLCSFHTFSVLVLAKHERSFDHSKVEAPPRKKWVRCKHCRYKTLTKRHLKQHVFCKHLHLLDPQYVKWFKCDQCPFKSPLRRMLKSHILAMHPDPNCVTLFKCPKCPRKGKNKEHVFLENKEFKKHFREEHGDLYYIEWTECDQC